jgi:UDP-N-acetylmuramyl pentapeptide synthase
MKDEMAETKSIPLETPSTKARNVVVINDIRNANMMAMKRGLSDMIALGKALG